MCYFVHRNWRKDKLYCKKVKFSDESHRERWLEALKINTIFSEESDNENDEDILVDRPLSWRSTEYEKLLKIIDKDQEDCRSSQAKKQLLKRVREPFSSQNQPDESDDIPRWV